MFSSFFSRLQNSIRQVLKKDNANKKTQPPKEESIAESAFTVPIKTVQNPELDEISEDLKNVIAFVNPKSGGQKGRLIFEKLKDFLPEENLCDLTTTTPKERLEKNKDKVDLKIIACGGDGTVAWVLSALDEINFDNRASVAVLPLGTGNDLARTMNWGGTYEDESISSFLKRVINGNVVKLDRWLITTKVNDTSDENTDAKDKLPVKVINNYFSIGVDAKIALDFHLAREKDPAAFSNPMANKIEYAKKYSKDLINQTCKDLSDEIEVFECDGKDVLSQLKEEEYDSILFLNIPNYCAGRNPWKNETDSMQHISDGKLEVIGFHTHDFMLLPLGGRGDKIAQARNVRIVTKKTIPMQVDGEPVLLKSAEIIIELKNQAFMIEADDEDIRRKLICYF